MDLVVFNKEAQKRKKANRHFYDQLKLRPPNKLDTLFHNEHEKVFAKTDCLTCANCCKTTSPIFYQRDIEKAAKALKQTPGAFIKEYLFMDKEGDFVLKEAPCPFLNENNHCSIYAARPQACKEYPHTNRKKMRQIMDITFKNTLVCPAVLEITERLKKILK